MARQRRERECPDIAAMLERMIRAYGRRVGDADPEDLARMSEVLRSFEEAYREAGRTQLQSFSTSMLGRALGVTKQAVAKRFAA